MMRKFMVSVNGNSYQVEVERVEEGFDQSDSTGIKSSTVKIEQEVIEAPMPGNILRVDVKEGQNIKAGDNLLILEAMKMENEIVSPRDGKVVSIFIAAGESVDTGDKLVIIE